MFKRQNFLHYLKVSGFAPTAIAALLLFSIAPTAYAKSFSDVPTTFWAYSAINKMSDDGIINGYTDGTFKPGATITNAEFIVMLLNALFITHAPNQPIKYAYQTWYEPFFKVAEHYPIITPGQFSGQENRPITRSNMALLVSNALYNLAAPANTQSVLDGFTDSAAIKELNAAQQNAIAKIASAGIISGDENKRFNPGNTATRAEAAVIISGFLAVFTAQYDSTSGVNEPNPEMVDRGREPWEELMAKLIPPDEISGANYYREGRLGREDPIKYFGFDELRNDIVHYANNDIFFFLTESLVNYAELMGINDLERVSVFPESLNSSAEITPVLISQVLFDVGFNSNSNMRVHIKMTQSVLPTELVNEITISNDANEKVYVKTLAR